MCGLDDHNLWVIDDQPVVIIEFKRPARSAYDDEENPFTQIYGYIEELRAGSVIDKEGGVIQNLDEQSESGEHGSPSPHVVTLPLRVCAAYSFLENQQQTNG